MNSEHPDAMSANFFANLFTQIPVLVVRLTPEGLVLAANPETVRATGYEASDLIGRNFWGLLFPGKLFQQVPKFLSTLQSGGTVRDRPMVMCTKNGKECVVAWSRFPNTGQDGRALEIICTGVDLTQRLIDADRPTLPEITVGSIMNDAVKQPNSIDGDFVLPLAISPPAGPNGKGQAIGDVDNFLITVDQRGNVLRSRFSKELTLAKAQGRDALQAVLNASQLDIDGQQSAIREVLLNIQNVVAMCNRKNGTEKR